MQRNYNDLPRISRQKRSPLDGKMSQLAFRGSVAAGTTASAALPRPFQVAVLRRQPQGPLADDVLERQVLGVQCGVLDAGCLSAQALETRHGRARTLVPKHGTQGIIVARGKQSHGASLPSDQQTAHEQLCDLRDQRFEHRVNVVVVVLVSWTNSSENCVVGIVRALLINEPDDNFHRRRAASFVQT